MQTFSMPMAVVFPGQGSQSLGMLSDFAQNELVRQTFREAETALGYPLWDLTQEGPEAQLNQTEYTQPALLTASVALWRVWQASSTITPSLLAGHSLGEYTALVCAGALSLKEAVTLVSKRGQFMQAAVKEGEGAMAAILGLLPEQVCELCDEVSNSTNIVSAANFNSSQQTVIAGHTQSVVKVMELAKNKGAKRVVRLMVSVPSHCALMKGASEKLAKVLEQLSLQVPSIPVLHNVDVQSHTSPEAIREALVLQLYKPVRWSECIEKMGSLGIKTIVECGPGQVLTGLNKRIVPDISCFSFSEGVVLCP